MTRVSLGLCATSAHWAVHILISFSLAGTARARSHSLQSCRASRPWVSERMVVGADIRPCGEISRRTLAQVPVRRLSEFVARTVAAGRVNGCAMDHGVHTELLAKVSPKTQLLVYAVALVQIQDLMGGPLGRRLPRCPCNPAWAFIWRWGIRNLSGAS
jgi:hypothetical protein